ncbi:MAG: hypothetical protein H6Q62_410, partial [Firmicutes bacterium]|nr:hypothetical protein [Bacillota bacterium]
MAIPEILCTAFNLQRAQVDNIIALL